MILTASDVIFIVELGNEMASPVASDPEYSKRPPMSVKPMDMIRMLILSTSGGGNFSHGRINTPHLNSQVMITDSPGKRRIKK
jgi:hypothetical protein